jgi:hypothetical protein
LKTCKRKFQTKKLLNARLARILSWLVKSLQPGGDSSLYVSVCCKPIAAKDLLKASNTFSVASLLTSSLGCFSVILKEICRARTEERKNPWDPKNLRLHKSRIKKKYPHLFTNMVWYTNNLHMKRKQWIFWILPKISGKVIEKNFDMRQQFRERIKTASSLCTTVSVLVLWRLWDAFCQIAMCWSKHILLFWSGSSRLSSIPKMKIALKEKYFSVLRSSRRTSLPKRMKFLRKSVVIVSYSFFF